MNTPAGPILFASSAHAGQINPLLVIAGELSRRHVPDLWFACTDDRRGDVESASVHSPIRFVSFGAVDTLKPLTEDAAFYAAATRGPMTTGSSVALMQWMF